MKLRKPLNTNDEGVSPGCTRLLRKNTYKHTMAEGHRHCFDFIEWFYIIVSLQVTKENTGCMFLCKWVLPFCQGSGVLLECLCQETASADVVPSPLASRCSWSQWAGPPCCHLESCTTTPCDNTRYPVHWWGEQSRMEKERKKRSETVQIRRAEKKEISVFLCLCCVLPARTELSGIGEILVQLLQHLLALSVRERVAEGEVGGGPSHLQQPVSEWEDELVIYNLEGRRDILLEG